MLQPLSLLNLRPFLVPHPARVSTSTEPICLPRPQLRSRDIPFEGSLRACCKTVNENLAAFQAEFVMQFHPLRPPFKPEDQTLSLVGEREATPASFYVTEVWSVRVSGPSIWMWAAANCRCWHVDWMLLERPRH